MQYAACLYSSLPCVAEGGVQFDSDYSVGDGASHFFHSGQCLGEGRKMYGILLIIWIDVVFKSLASFAISTHNCVQNALFEYTSLLWKPDQCPLPTNLNLSPGSESWDCDLQTGLRNTAKREKGPIILRPW